jgi:hypothetical protein
MAVAAVQVPEMRRQGGLEFSAFCVARLKMLREWQIV